MSGIEFQKGIDRGSQLLQGFVHALALFNIAVFNETDNGAICAVDGVVVFDGVFISMIRVKHALNNNIKIIKL